MTFVEMLRAARLVPVLTIEHERDAVPLARALVAGGLRVLEVTLRTAAALAAARAIMAEVAEATVGLGTATRPRDVEAAVAIGAAFVVSPGLTPGLAAAAKSCGLPFLPGTATVSEVLAAREHGFDTLKFFPAELAGGTAALSGIAPLVPDVRFCPTGGIGPDNVRDYLALPNVLCVGGSWMAPARLIEARAWREITEQAARAGSLAA